mmetsp:Transcript_43237/g.113763  ORF Transcript_43237/g.113763 Transcript_43237/m.113763 type:complete len:88 (-) Transcript_43237:212-475(-)
MIDNLAADEKYKGKVNFLLLNMTSLDSADEYAKKQSLTGAAMHGHTGGPFSEYGVKYIPHKVLIDGKGVVVKNFDVDLPKDVDALIG